MSHLTKTCQPAPNVLIQQGPLPTTQGGHIMGGAGGGQPPYGGHPMSYPNNPRMPPGSGPPHPGPPGSYGAPSGPMGGPRGAPSGPPRAYHQANVPSPAMSGIGSPQPIFSSVPSPAGGVRPPQHHPGGEMHPSGMPMQPGGAGGPQIPPHMQGHPHPGQQHPPPAHESQMQIQIKNSSLWNKDYWQKHGEPVPPILQRLDSHSPLMLSRIGKEKTQEVLAKTSEIFNALMNKHLELYTLHAMGTETARDSRHQMLANVKRNVDTIQIILSKLREIYTILNDKQGELPPPHRRQSYEEFLIQKAEGKQDSEPNPLAIQRDQLKERLREKEKILADVSDKLKYIQWEVGSALAPL